MGSKGPVSGDGGALPRGRHGHCVGLAAVDGQLQFVLEW